MKFQKSMMILFSLLFLGPHLLQGMDENLLNNVINGPTDEEIIKGYLWTVGREISTRKDKTPEGLNGNESDCKKCHRYYKYVLNLDEKEICLPCALATRGKKYFAKGQEGQNIKIKYEGRKYHVRDIIEKLPSVTDGDSIPQILFNGAISTYGFLIRDDIKLKNAEGVGNVFRILAPSYHACIGATLLTFVIAQYGKRKDCAFGFQFSSGTLIQFLFVIGLASAYQTENYDFGSTILILITLMSAFTGWVRNKCGFELYKESFQRFLQLQPIKAIAPNHITVNDYWSEDDGFFCIHLWHYLWPMISVTGIGTMSSLIHHKEDFGDGGVLQGEGIMLTLWIFNLLAAIYSGAWKKMVTLNFIFMTIFATSCGVLVTFNADEKLWISIWSFVVEIVVLFPMVGMREKIEQWLTQLFGASNPNNNPVGNIQNLKRKFDQIMENQIIPENENEDKKGGTYVNLDDDDKKEKDSKDKAAIELQKKEEGDNQNKK